MSDLYSSQVSFDLTTKVSDRVWFEKQDERATLPTRATGASAAFDLYAIEDTTIIGGMGNVLVKTGVGIGLPEGRYGRLAVRSGGAKDDHLTITAGVIDRDYHRAIGCYISCTKVIEMVDGKPELRPHVAVIKAGERFAQIVIEMCDDRAPEEDPKRMCPRPEHKHEGFGSTGKK